MSSKSAFSCAPGFCSECGSILPLIKEKGNIVCFTCATEIGVEEFGNIEVNYTIHFNSLDTYAKQAADKENAKSVEGEEGPVVERKCPRCGCPKMSYATLQLRSADEGQTVFYTCIKCNFKETENS